MKRVIFILTALILSLFFSACANSSQPETSSQDSVLRSHDEILESSAEELSEISEQSQLPAMLTRNSNGSLKYKNDFLSMSVSFPADFCIVDESYTPVNGIYLRNIEGTATLQLESVEDNDVSPNDLADYLREKYEGSVVYVTDTKDVVCKNTVTDRKGNRVVSYLKIRTKKGGYNEAILYFHEENQEKFENLFNQIIFN